MSEILSVSFPSHSLPLYCEAELGEIPFAAPVFAGIFPPETLAPVPS